MLLFLKKNKNQIAAFLRLAFFSGLVFVAVLLVGIAILVYIYRDNIKDVLIHNLNRGLKTELSIEQIRVNIFRNFPLVSLTLKNVMAKEPENFPDRDTLLFAERVYFQMSVLDLLRRSYKIRQIELARANLHMKFFQDQTNNFTIWKSPEDQGKEFFFELQSVEFQDVAIKITDFGNQNFFDLHLKRAEMQGNFAHKSYIMKLNGDLFLKRIVLNDMTVTNNRNLEFELGFDVINNNVFHFREGIFALGNNMLNASGSLDFSGDKPFLNLQFAGKQLEIGSVIQDLPPNLGNYFAGFRSNGVFYFDAIVKGELSERQSPFIKANFGIESGFLSHNRSNLHFTDLNFDASFNNGNARNLSTSMLELKGLTVNLNNGTLQSNGRLINFKKPQIDVDFFSDIRVDDLLRFLQIDTIHSAAGNLLVDLRYRGGLGYGGKFTTREFLGSEVEGILKADSVSFTFKNSPLYYHNISADLVFNNNDVKVNHLSANVSESDFALSGIFKNVLPWLFLENEKIIVDANLQSSKINFNQLLQHSVSEGDTTYKLRLSEKIDFRLNVDIGDLAFKRFNASGIKGFLSLQDQVFRASDLNFSAMNGRVKASGYIDGRNQAKLKIGSRAYIDNVDVYQLFYQFRNFGQTSITKDNLRGRLFSDLNFRSEWSPYLKIDIGTLEIISDTRIENGELLNYKPLLALSRFIRVGDLEHVRFSTLENQITIRDRKIIIPEMSINSNAINIKLSGEHTFQNEINYRLQVLLSEILANRHRQNRNPQEQFGDIIDDGRGRTTLFLLVTGTLNDPVFRYDRQGVREKIRDDFRREGQILRDVFRTEFGLPHPRPSAPGNNDQNISPQQNQQQEIKRREEGRFILEWDE